MVQWKNKRRKAESDKENGGKMQFQEIKTHRENKTGVVLTYNEC